MPYDPILTAPYESSLKNLIKAYPLSKSDVESLVDHVTMKPQNGSAIPGFDNLLFKIRWPQKAYRIGSSGGLRLIYCFNGVKLYLIYIYSKKKQANPPYELLKEWLKAEGFSPK